MNTQQVTSKPIAWQSDLIQIDTSNVRVMVHGAEVIVDQEDGDETTRHVYTPDEARNFAVSLTQLAEAMLNAANRAEQSEVIA